MSILDPNASLGSYSRHRNHSRRNPSLDFFIIHNRVSTWLGVQVGAPSPTQIWFFFFKKKKRCKKEKDSHVNEAPLV